MGLGQRHWREEREEGGRRGRGKGEIGRGGRSDRDEGEERYMVFNAKTERRDKNSDVMRQLRHGTVAVSSLAKPLLSALITLLTVITQHQATGEETEASNHNSFSLSFSLSLMVFHFHLSISLIQSLSFFLSLSLSLFLSLLPVCFHAEGGVCVLPPPVDAARFDRHHRRSCRRVVWCEEVWEREE